MLGGWLCTHAYIYQTVYANQFTLSIHDAPVCVCVCVSLSLSRDLSPPMYLFSLLARSLLKLVYMSVHAFCSYCPRDSFVRHVCKTFRRHRLRSRYLAGLAAVCCGYLFSPSLGPPPSACISVRCPRCLTVHLRRPPSNPRSITTTQHTRMPFVEHYETGERRGGPRTLLLACTCPWTCPYNRICNV